MGIDRQRRARTHVRHVAEVDGPLLDDRGDVLHRVFHQPAGRPVQRHRRQPGLLVDAAGSRARGAAVVLLRDSGRPLRIPAGAARNRRRCRRTPTRSRPCDGRVGSRRRDRSPLCRVPRLVVSRQLDPVCLGGREDAVAADAPDPSGLLVSGRGARSTAPRHSAFACQWRIGDARPRLGGAGRSRRHAARRPAFRRSRRRRDRAHCGVGGSRARSRYSSSPSSSAG